MVNARDSPEGIENTKLPGPVRVIAAPTPVLFSMETCTSFSLEQGLNLNVVILLKSIPPRAATLQSIMSKEYVPRFTTNTRLSPLGTLKM
jgi:hypothetical protein